MIDDEFYLCGYPSYHVYAVPGEDADFNNMTHTELLQMKDDDDTILYVETNATFHLFTDLPLGENFTVLVTATITNDEIGLLPVHSLNRQGTVTKVAALDTLVKDDYMGIIHLPRPSDTFSIVVVENTLVLSSESAADMPSVVNDLVPGILFYSFTDDEDVYMGKVLSGNAMNSPTYLEFTFQEANVDDIFSSLDMSAVTDSLEPDESLSEPGDLLDADADFDDLGELEDEIRRRLWGGGGAEEL